MNQIRIFVAVIATTAAVGLRAQTNPPPGILNDFVHSSVPAFSMLDAGGDWRVRFENQGGYTVTGLAGSADFRGPGAPENNTYLLSRLRVHAGYANNGYAVYVEGRSSRTGNDKRNPNLETDGPLDLQQLYIRIGGTKSLPVSLKVGRQELSYGDERLIGAFGWNNIGRVFDAAKVSWKGSNFTLDAFTAHVVIPNNTKFNAPNLHDSLSGLYLTTNEIPKQATDVYILARNASVAVPVTNLNPGDLVSRASPRDIYTFGLRGKSAPKAFGNFDYLYELDWQAGHFTDPALPVANRKLRQQAYAAVVQVGYSLPAVFSSPRFAFEYDLGSGDKNPTDGKHTTFDNLYPTNHRFYGSLDMASLQNLRDASLAAQFKPISALKVSFEAHSLWLDSTNDNFYQVNGARRGGITATPGTGFGINPSYSRHLGYELNWVTAFAATRYLNFDLGLGRFFVGDYIKSSYSAVGSRDANFVYVQSTFKF